MQIVGLLLAANNGIGTDGQVSGDPDGNPDAIAVASQDQPLSVNIGGAGYANSGTPAYFNAHVSGEEGTVSYQWYYRVSPHNSWTKDNGATSSSYSRTFYNPGGYENQG